MIILSRPCVIWSYVAPRNPTCNNVSTYTYRQKSALVFVFRNSPNDYLLCFCALVFPLKLNSTILVYQSLIVNTPFIKVAVWNAPFAWLVINILPSTLIRSANASLKLSTQHLNSSK